MYLIIVVDMKNIKKSIERLKTPKSRKLPYYEKILLKPTKEMFQIWPKIAEQKKTKNCGGKFCCKLYSTAKRHCSQNANQKVKTKKEYLSEQIYYTI